MFYHTTKLRTCLSAVIFIFSLSTAHACDMCGCGAGGFYLGIVPNFTQNAIGIRYQNQQFSHPRTSLNLNGESLVESDFMQRYDTWLRFYLSKRLQLFTFVPYQIHTRRESMRNTTITGVGDMRFRILYTIINTGDSLEGKWKHSLLAGGELRLPTGKYQQRDETRKMLPPLFQIGTGAYGYGAQIMYTLRYKGFGLYSDAQYAINGINELGYRWGNQQAHSLRVFYWKNAGNISILPGIGIAFEDFAPDTEFGMQQIHTGGRTTWGHLGVDIYTDQWTLQLFAHTPLQMNLPDSMPESRWRMAIAWGYFF